MWCAPGRCSPGCAGATVPRFSRRGRSCSQAGRVRVVDASLRSGARGSLRKRVQRPALLVTRADVPARQTRRTFTWRLAEWARGGAPDAAAPGDRAARRAMSARHAFRQRITSRNNSWGDAVCVTVSALAVIPWTGPTSRHGRRENEPNRHGELPAARQPNTSAAYRESHHFRVALVAITARRVLPRRCLHVVRSNLFRSPLPCSTSHVASRRRSKQQQQPCGTSTHGSSWPVRRRRLCRAAPAVAA